MFIAKRRFRAEGQVFEKGKKYKSVPKDVEYFFDQVKDEEPPKPRKKKGEKKPDVRTR